MDRGDRGGVGRADHPVDDARDEGGFDQANRVLDPVAVDRHGLRSPISTGGAEREVKP